MLLRLLAALLILGLLVGGVFGWKYYQGQQQMSAQMAPPPATVAATRVSEQDWQAELPAVGSLLASQRLLVTNEVSGRLVKLAFASGKTVAEGELLVQLDDRVDQAELRGLIADRRLAEIQFQRLAKLLNDRSVSRADYDQAKATLDQRTAAVEGKRELIAKMAIKAPFSGQLGIRQVEQGEFLPVGTTIVGLEALDPMFVDFSVPEQHFAVLHVGQAVRVRVRAWPGQVFAGEVSAINPNIDTGTRSVKLRATLANPQGRLRSGMFAQVDTILPLRSGVLSLPRTAISFNPYGAFVYVIEGEEGALTVSSRRVETGSVRGGRVEISAGLRAGERVVSAGQGKLRNSQAVVIDKDDPLSDAAGASPSGADAAGAQSATSGTAP